jgi:hypothetical protein
VFVLARIAGHSSITITQRYVHPQADAIGRVFSQVGTKLGTVQNLPKGDESEENNRGNAKPRMNIGDESGAGRGSRTPKTRRSADFESAASASSAIPALRGSAYF